MLSIILKNKKTIIIGILILMVSVAVYSFTIKKKLVPAIVPNDDVSSHPTQEQRDKANAIARALFTAMDGFEINPWTRDVSAFQNLSSSSDQVFVLAYNRYNELYEGEDKGSLRQWLKDESYIKEHEDLVYNTILPRMDRLNLK